MKSGDWKPRLLAWARAHAAHPKHPLIPIALQCDPRKDFEQVLTPKTDIWWGGTGDPFLQAAEQGLLAEYRPAYLHDLHSWSVRQYAMSGH